jgi:hypothetical protein
MLFQHLESNNIYHENLDKMTQEQLRMQMLAGIITESQYKQKLNEEISIQDFNPKDIYDFGGAEDPLNDTVTVVDIEDKDFRNEDFKGEWITADLENFIKLPPKKVIHFGDSLNYFNGLGLVKTVHNTLLPGGYIFHSGYYSDISYLFNKLSKLGNYKAINFNPNIDPDEDDIEETDEYQIIKKL